MLAFLILVVVSALAAVIIGDLVLGQKVVELASSKAEVGLKLTDLYLKEHLKRLELIGRSLHSVEAGSSQCEVLSQAVADGMVVADFSVDVKPEAIDLQRVSASPAWPEQDVPDGNSECTAVSLPMEGWRKSELARFSTQALASGGNLSGVVAVGHETLTFLGYNSGFGDGLLLLAASGSDVPGSLHIVGTLLNGREQLATVPLSLLWPGPSRRWAATYFLKDRRIATSIGEEGIGTRVDPRVLREVMEKGNVFVGEAEVTNRTFHAAYMPLRDYRGDIVGMLGIGAEKDIYSDIRNRTIALFATIITAGMLIGIFMTFFFSRWLMKPIGELAEGMNRVARGDRDYKVRLHTEDELGQLARAFNLMVKGIKERDIALRDGATERLSHVEKQVSIGRLAAGVAHEINNPLTSVLTLSSLLLKHTNDEDSHREDLEIIVEETTRCRDIVRNLLDFARERPARKQVVDVNDILRDTLMLTSKYEVMKQVRSEVRLADQLLWVNCDAKQLQQVFTNIIANAGEASGPNGKVMVVSDEDSSGSFTQVRIMDTGPGIEPENMDRIFEPFFTTKGPGKGTGLGLSISLGIVQKHSGTIEIDSKVGRGTTVSVFIPRVSPDGAPIST